MAMWLSGANRRTNRGPIEGLHCGGLPIRCDCDQLPHRLASSNPQPICSNDRGAKIGGFERAQ